MEEWKECKLEQVCENIYSGGTPATMVKEYWNGNLPWLSSGETGQRYIYSTEKTITQLGVDNSSTRYAYKNSTVVASAGQGYTRGQASFLTIDTYVNQSVIVLKPNIKLIDPKYLYFNIDNRYAELRQLSDGTSTRGSLSGKIMKDLSIKLPPLSTQQKIAAILSSLDDKIELNNKINTNLERQAGALFKNWFVDFEPFGGKMPEEWKIGKLSEYCNFQEGYVNPAQTHNEYFDGDVKWLRAVDINESFILNTSRTLTKCGFESAGKSAFLFKPGSIAISKSGTVGRLGIISDFMCGNRAVIGIELKEQQNLSYIHQYLKSRQTEFPDMAVGSVQKNLYVSILENLDIIIPSKEVLEKYAKICIPFYDQIKTNCIENNNLCSIRDTLLPKVMNGEIEV